MPTVPVTDTASNLTGYYNRMAPGGAGSAPKWIDIRFRAGCGLQSAELNELQTLINQRYAAFGDATFKSGGIITGSIPTIVGGAGVPNIQISDGSIYFAGAIHVVPGDTMQIPMTGHVTVGIRYREYEITETDDAALRDPAVTARNYQEPGAGRAVADWLWGWVGDTSDDGKSSLVDGSGNKIWSLFPIFDVQDGTIVVKSPPPVADAVLELVAKYDREANGNYVVTGLIVTYNTSDSTNYLFNLSEGEADILGYKVNILSGTRLAYPKNDFDVESVEGESHILAADLDGTATVWINRDPLAAYSRLLGVKQKTVTLTRDTVSISDEVPDATILSIVEVKQGGTTYTPTTDYILSGDTVNWSPGHSAPTAGSTYTVKYWYRTDVTPIATFPDHLVFNTLAADPVNGLVNGQIVEIDYTYKLPRVDLIVLNRDGTIQRITGTPQRRNPVAPRASDYQIGLATITLTWTDDPNVSNVSVRALTMADLQTMSSRLDAAYDLIGQLQLANKALVSNAEAKKGIWVEPFNDDSGRDAGITQTGAVGQNQLNLPITPTVLQPSDVDTRATWHTLPYDLEIVIQQPSKTGCIKINPYQSFAPPPARITLNPASDYWVVYVYQWLSPVWQKFNTQHWDVNHQTIVTQASKVSVISNNAVAVTTVRQREIDFNVAGFGPGETLTQVTFDGVDVTPA